ncbi:MAG: signal peptidase I [Campylobacter sp.]|nr:signal peptidase I [Campylobacter sp.]
MKNFLLKLYEFSSSWKGTVIIVLFIIFFVAQAFVIPSGSMKNTLLIGDHLFVKKFSYGIPTPHLPWIEKAVLPDFDGDGHILRGDMPKRGEIVVFRYPPNPKMHFVKRNFAVGGDEVIFNESGMYLRPHEGDEFIRANFNKNDIVTINNQLFVKEPYKYKGIHYDEKVDIMALAAKYAVIDQFAMQPLNFSEFPPNSLGFNAFYIKVPDDEFFMIGDNRNNSNDSRFWGSVPYKFIVGKPWFVYFSWNSNKEIRWERIGRFVDTLENDERFIYDQP